MEIGTRDINKLHQEWLCGVHWFILYSYGLQFIKINGKVAVLSIAASSNSPVKLSELHVRLAPNQISSVFPGMVDFEHRRVLLSSFVPA